VNRKHDYALSTFVAVWRKTCCSLVLLLSLVLGSSAFAQKTTGTMRGLVTDNTGAAVVGATVAIANTATGEVRTVVSNEQGEFVALELQAESTMSVPGR